MKISPVVAKLLCQRGLSDPELADRFLNPSLDHLHDPMLLKDMDVAVDRILAAIARREKIAIHGDYDVDGVTSTVILRRALELLGGTVIHFIPERLKDGYGLGWSTAGATFGHGGAYATNMTIDAKRGLITVFMVQHAGFPQDGGRSHGVFRQAALERFGNSRK